MLRTISVPTVWADIKLKDFQRFMGANPTDDTAEDLALAIFCGIDKDEQASFPVSELEDIKTIIAGVFTENPPDSIPSWRTSRSVSSWTWRSI